MVIFAAVILFFLAGLFIFIKFHYDKQFPRFDKPEFSGELRYSDIKGLVRTELTFKSGKNTLKGYLYGESSRKGLVVIAHGLMSGSEEYLAETLYFADHGWCVFTYDCTGSHGSEGKGTIGLSQSAIDLNAALNTVKNNEQLKNLPVMLYGHSWGGYAVMAVLNFKHNIAASVSVAGYNSPMEILMEREKRTLGTFTFLLYPFGYIYQMILFGQAAMMTAADGINGSDAQVLIIHGDSDKVISYKGAAIIAHKNEIVNPKTVYKTCSREFRSGHSNMHLTAEASFYKTQKDHELKALNERFSGNIPHDVLKEFYDGYDKVKANELDLEFMDEINAFYESSISLNKATGINDYE